MCCFETFALILGHVVCDVSLDALETFGFPVFEDVGEV